MVLVATRGGRCTSEAVLAVRCIDRAEAARSAVTSATQQGLPLSMFTKVFDFLSGPTPRAKETEAAKDGAVRRRQRRRSRKGRPECLRLARWPLALLRCPIWSRRWRHHSQTRSRAARCSAATAIISRPGTKTQTCTTEEAQHGRNASSIWWPLGVGKPVRQYFTRLLVQKYDSDSDI